VPTFFARYADKVARAIGDRIHAAITFNEPNILLLLQNANVPAELWKIEKLTLETAAKRLAVPRFLSANVAGLDDLPDLQKGLLAAHKAGRAAIKAAAPRLPVGLSLAMMDDQAVGRNSQRDARRQQMYGAWLDVAKGDEFLGVQNYERALWGPQGRLPAPADAVRNWSGSEVYAPSLAGAVRYAHQATGVPILVSEHGVGTDDDTVRAALIPAALRDLKHAIDDGVPVMGYCHWSLIDNFEWVFGYRPKFGLASYDPITFARTPKPSAAVLGSIARANRV
jgi:beta-glucosidase